MALCCGVRRAVCGVLWSVMVLLLLRLSSRVFIDISTAVEAA